MTKKDKKELHELYERHYGKGKKKSKTTKAKESVEEKAEAKQVSTTGKQSRGDLMLQAKAKGIKNFRVLNREELMKVLAPKATEEIIAQVVQGAVVRWKSGWGKKGGRSTPQLA